MPKDLSATATFVATQRKCSEIIIRQWPT